MEILIWNRTIQLNVYIAKEYDFDRNVKVFETAEADSIDSVKGEYP